MGRYNYSPYSKMEHKDIIQILRAYGFDQDMNMNMDVEIGRERIIDMLNREKEKYQCQVGE